MGRPLGSRNGEPKPLKALTVRITPEVVEALKHVSPYSQGEIVEMALRNFLGLAPMADPVPNSPYVRDRRSFAQKVMADRDRTWPNHKDLVVSRGELLIKRRTATGKVGGFGVYLKMPDELLEVCKMTCKDLDCVKWNAAVYKHVLEMPGYNLVGMDLKQTIAEYLVNQPRDVVDARLAEVKQWLAVERERLL